MEQDSTQSPPPSPNITYSFRCLTSHERMFKNKEDSYQKHKNIVRRVRVGLELEEEEMEILQTSYAPRRTGGGGGGSLIFPC